MQIHTKPTLSLQDPEGSMHAKQSSLETSTRTVTDEQLPAALAILWVLYTTEML